MARRPARRLAVVPLLLIPAACATAVSGSASPEAPSSATPAGVPRGTGPLDELLLTWSVTSQVAATAEIRGLAVRADGEPVVVVAGADEFAAHTVSDAAEGWSVSGLAQLRGLSDLDASPDGSVVLAGDVTTDDGAGVGLLVIDPDGHVTTSTVQEDVEARYLTDVRAALSPDGRTVHLSLRGAEPQLYAVRPADGEVTARLPLEVDGRVADTDIHTLAVSPDGAPLVGAIDAHGDGVLLRSDARLRSLGQVPLTAEGEEADVVQLAVAADGTAFVAVGVVGGDGREVRLLQIPADAEEPRAVHTWPGTSDVRGLAVDPAGEWAYVGLAGDPTAGNQVTVTPVDLATAAPAAPVVLCAHGTIDHTSLLLTPDATRLAVAGSCDDRSEDEQVVWLVE